MESYNPLHFLRIYVKNNPQAFGQAVVANYPKRIKVSVGATSKDGTRLARIRDVSESAKRAAQRVGFSPAEQTSAYLAAYRAALDRGFSTAGTGR